MRRNPPPQQNDTNVTAFDERLLSLEAFFWSNVIFKFCFFCFKIHKWGREEFPWVPSPDCNTAEFIRNECLTLYSCCLRFSKQEQTLYQGKPNMGKFSVRQKIIVTFETEVANLKMILPQKNGHKIKIPLSKWMILVSSCWKKHFIRNNAHNLFIMSLVFLEIIDHRCCVLSGPPCKMHLRYIGPSLYRDVPVSRIWLTLFYFLQFEIVNAKEFPKWCISGRFLQNIDNAFNLMNKKPRKNRSLFSVSSCLLIVVMEFY